MRTLVSTVMGALLLGLPAALPGQSPLERLGVHGFLTQAYATSSEAQLFGVPTDGTFDYRSAAVQLRYRVTGSDHLVIQLDHRRLGSSVLTQDASLVRLDWAFYQRFVGGFNARLGRVPIPQGIYNEIRDVGVLLPFYRAPANFYMEGFEAIDGAALSYGHVLGDWRVEANVFGGAFDFRSVSASADGPELSVQRRKRALGTQLWLETPVTGVRVGLGAMRWDVDAADGEDAAEFSWRAAVDAALGRALARAEYRAMDHVGHSMVSYYGQAGFRVTDGVVVNAQAEFEDRSMIMGMHGMDDMHGMDEMGAMTDTQGAGSMSTADDDMSTASAGQQLEFRHARDFAIGVNYRVSRRLVLKTEAHKADGYNFDDFFSPMGDAGRTEYFIASLAIAF